VSEHPLEMVPRVGQIAHVMLRCPDHSLTDPPIVQLGPRRRQSMEPLRQGQGDAMVGTANVMRGPQAPERAQLVLHVTEAHGNLEGLCPGCADFGNATSGVRQRRAQRGEELHLAARVRAGTGTDSSESPLDPAAALLH